MVVLLGWFFYVGGLLGAAVSESSLSAFCGVEGGDGYELGLFASGNDHLGYALSVSDGVGLAAEVDEYDAYLASIVGVDGAWGVEHGDAVFEGEAAAGAYLGFVAGGKGDAQACGYEGSLHGLELYGAVEVGAEVHACALGGGVGGEGVVTVVDYSYGFHRVCGLGWSEGRYAHAVDLAIHVHGVDVGHA